MGLSPESLGGTRKYIMDKCHYILFIYGQEEECQTVFSFFIYGICFPKYFLYNQIKIFVTTNLFSCKFFSDYI